MTKRAFDKIAAGLNDAIAFAGGDRSRAKVVRPVNVKAIRQATRMTQAQFAEAFRLSIGTLRDWEQHRREPDATAKAYLSIIEQDPSTVRELAARVS